LKNKCAKATCNGVVPVVTIAAKIPVIVYDGRNS
jgi:hypothetical protein